MQLEDLNFSDDEILIAQEILGNQNENGFLSIEPVLISDRLNIREDEVIDIMKEIQKLDPLGIASISDKISFFPYFFIKDTLSFIVFGST